MGKKVIVCDGNFRVYRTLSELSGEVGVSPGELSRALDDGRPVFGRRMRWAERVFAVRVLGVGWTVCVRDSRGRLVLLGDPDRRIRMRDVEEVKDVTAVWYYGREEW